MALGNLGVTGVSAGDALPVFLETPDGDSAMDDTNDAVRVNIVAGSAAGTEYTEGAVDASITGTALVFEGAADTLVAATGDATNGLDVDVTRLPALVAGTANIGDVDVLSVPAPLSTTGGGTEATALRVTIASDSTGLVSVDDNGGNLSVDWAGTVPPIGAGTEAAALRVTLATDSTGLVSVDGTVADDGITPSAPVMVGGQSKNFDGTDPGNVDTEDDVARCVLDRNRRLLVNAVHPRFWSYHENSSSALTDASVQAAPAANYSIFVTDIVFSSGAATAINIFFEEGASTVLGPYYLEAVAGRGLTVHFVTPKQITAATALTVTTSAAIAHGLDVTGFIARVT